MGFRGIEILARDVPPALLAAFPTYKGRTFQVRACESVTIMDTTWSGGTKCTYTLVELATGRVAPLDTSRKSVKPGDPFGWIPDVEGQSFRIPPGYVVAEHSHFCGKDMGITFHANPADLTPLLPPAVELTERERLILGIFVGYTSAGRKEYLPRHKVTEGEIQGLIARGFLSRNKAGATGATMEGRNAYSAGPRAKGL